jgi:hypothetical protein
LGKGRCNNTALSDHRPPRHHERMSRSVLYGIIGGLAWFVVGLLVGHYVW